MDRDYCPECDQYVVASVLAEYGRCLGCVERTRQADRERYKVIVETALAVPCCPDCGGLTGKSTHVDGCCEHCVGKRLLALFA